MEALYDLYYDPVEQKNLIQVARYQEIAKKMRVKLKSLMEETQDPLLKGPININPEWKVNKRDCFSPGSKNIEDYESLGSSKVNSYH